MASQIKSQPRPASASAQQAAKVKNYVNQQIEKTRQQVKTVDLMAGALMLFVYSLAFLLAMSLIDAWIWPLSPAARWVCLGMLIVGGLAYTAFSILPLFLKRINPDYAAKMIEEVEPNFQNSLINYVSFRKQPNSIRPAVLDAISRQAATDLASVPGDATVDRSKLIRLGFVLIGLTAFAVGYKLLSPKDPLQTFGRILFPAAKIAQPARVNISNVEPGDTDLFFGDKLVVTAEVRGAHRSDDVRLVYSTLDGQLVDQSIPMQLADDSNYRYQAELSMVGGGVQSSLTYKVTASDGSSPDYEVNVRPNPSITIESVQLDPPKYTGLDQRTLAGQGDIEAVEGTWVTVNAIANLPIEVAYIELLNEASSASQRTTSSAQPSQYRIATTPLKMESEGRSANGRFQITLDSSREKPFASHYRIRFVSTQDHRNANPNVYPIRVIPDQAPEIRFRNPIQTEVEVPVNGALAIDVEASDLDFSISSVELSIDHQGAKIFDKALPLSSDDQNRSVTARHVLRPSELGLKPGDQAVFFARAADNRVSPYSQQRDPNISRTENYFLKVTAWDQETERKKQQPSEPQPSDTPDQNPSQQPQQKPEQSPTKDQSNDSADQGNDGSDTGENEQPQNQPSDSDSKQETGTDDSQSDGESESESSDGNQGSQEQPNGNNSGSTENQNTGSQSGSDSSDQPESESQGGDSRGSGADGQPNESTSNQTDSNDRGSGSSESPTQQPENPNSDNRSGAGNQSGGTGDGSDNPNGGSATDAADRDGTGQSPTSDSSDSGTPERRDDSLTDGDQEVLPENASDGQRFETIKKHLDENGQSNPQPNSDPSNQSQSSPQNRQNDSASGSPGENPNTDSQPNPSGKSDQPATQPGAESENTQEPSGDNQPNNSPGADSQNQPNQNGASSSDSNQQPNRSPSSQNQQPESENSAGQRGSNDSGEPSQGSDPGSEKGEAPQQGTGDSQSQSPSQNQPNQSGDPSQQPTENSGSADQDSKSPNENGGNPSSQNSSQQNPSASQSQNPPDNGGQPGQGDPSQSKSSQSSNNSSSQNRSSGGTGGSSSNQNDSQKRDETNLDYAKKVVELSLEKLRDQPSDPELLRKLNMTQQELDQFLDRYRKMKLAAETGDARAKAIYKSSLPPLGIKDPTQRRTNARRAGTVENLIEDAAVNRPPPEHAREFNSFMRNMQRIGNQ